MSGSGKKKNWIWLKNLWGAFEKLFIGFWPVVLGVLTLYPNLPTSSLRFLDIVFTPQLKFKDFPVDFPVLGIWLLIALWPILFLVSERKKERNERQAHSDLRDALLNAPNYKILNKARRHLDTNESILDEVDVHISEFEQNNFTNIEKLISALLVVNQTTKNLIADFFNLNEADVRITIMIFIEKSPANQIALEKLLAKKTIYKREAHDQDMIGILFLPFDFNDRPRATSFEISMPIYPMAAKVYNSPELNQHDDITLPGAPLAFLKDNSFIGDTRSRRNYENLDEVTRAEIVSYFAETNTEIRSLASFKIPTKSNQMAIGVLNIESSETSTFSRDEDQFNTLYTFIYPTLKIEAKYLEYYKRYILSILLN